MSYPQDPQGWQPPGSGGYPQQHPGYPQQPGGYEQQPGGYNPGGGYGDPYAQPGGYQPSYDPTSGQPQNPPTSAPPGSVPPGSGPPGPLPPTGPLQSPAYGYGPQAAPTSGYPTSGYPSTGYPAPGYPGGPVPGAPVPPPKKSKTGLIIGIIAAAVVLICVVGGIGGIFLLRDDDPEPKPGPTAQPGPTTQTPAVPPSPTADPPLLSKFVDPELRDFARNGAARANECTVVTTTIPAINAVTEAVRCTYTGDYQVYFAHYKTLEDRDRYTTSARNGFGSKTYTVDDDSFWTDDKSVRQGSYITAYKNTDNSRFTYWDRTGAAISAEVYSTGTDPVSIETFWKSIR
jgi:hypothetical protein